jgi:hypothetical protein
LCQTVLGCYESCHESEVAMSLNLKG